MAKAEWGVDPGFFGPRHAHRERRILTALNEYSNLRGPHLECAAGVGSLSVSIATQGRRVVAADLSLRSLAVLKKRLAEGLRISLVVADITRLPFADEAFGSATSAETLEHIPDDAAAVRELSRVLSVGGLLVGTVPAGPKQWSDWDLWADHQRRYTRVDMEDLLQQGSLEPKVTVWGWPIVRLYDDFFLKRVNRRRYRTAGSVEQDGALRRVSDLGRRRSLVRTVRMFFAFDHLFDGVRWGVGLLFVGAKDKPGADH